MIATPFRPRFHSHRKLAAFASLLCTAFASHAQSAADSPGQPAPFVPAEMHGCPAPSPRSTLNIQEGRVELGLVVGSFSKVTIIQIINSSGHAELDRAAVLAARQCKVTAGVKDGKSVSSWVPIKLEYRAPEQYDWARITDPAYPAAASSSKSSRIINSTCVHPSYPREALRAEAQGTVEILFRVDVQGEVTDGVLAKSSGNDLLDTTAYQALRQCRFQPSRIQGTPVVSWNPVRYVWKIGPKR